MAGPRGMMAPVMMPVPVAPVMVPVPVTAMMVPAMAMAPVMPVAVSAPAHRDDPAVGERRKVDRGAEIRGRRAPRRQGEEPHEETREETCTENHREK
ncbi:hypothetical protein AEGHOMDF_4543 [Methylobacterium soli]|nr:hypothetical protein AEGHOMDF_4543 [Methylobacterium soli]